MVPTQSGLAEAARSGLLDSAARMQAILDAATDAFVSLDGDGTVTAWNAAAERTFGWSRDEALGQHVVDLVIPERQRRARRRALALVAGSGVSPAGRRVELTALDRAGREFPIELSLQVSVELGQARCHAFVRDITDRLVTQAALERERRLLTDERSFLQALLDSLDTGVVACDSTGRLALFNQALLRMLDSSVQPLDAETWFQTYDLFHPDGRTRLAPDEVPLARAFAGETVHGQEMVIAAPGVAARRFLTNGRHIDTSDGRRLGAVVAMHDITDSHRAEGTRRVQHAVAQALSDAGSATEAATAAIAAVAGELGWPAGDYWQVDDADQQGGEQTLTRASFWPPADDASPEAAEPLTLGLGVGLPGEIWAQGTTMWSTDSATQRRGSGTEPEPRLRVGLPVRSGQRVLGVLTFVVDGEETPHPDTLTMLEAVCNHIGRYLERRRAEDLTLALAAARRDFHRVVEQVNDYLWTIEVVPEGSFRSVYASPNGTGVFGDLMPAGPDTAMLADRIHPDDRPAFAVFYDTVSAEEPAEIECRVLGYDSVTRWVWTRGVPRREDDRLFVDGVSTNITERHQLAEGREQLLAQEQRQVRRLRELDQIKDELVAVVSHELRNPIGAIRGYTEMLLDDPDLPAEHRGYAEVIDRTSLHLKHLVDDLLDLASLDAGHIHIDPRPLSAARVFRDALEDHRPAAAAKNLTVTAEIAQHLPVYGDAIRLRQILDNLLSNAIKYTPDGGSVRVTASQGEGGVLLTVTDTGIGIPPEQHAQLFTRFFRASTALEHRIKGTGLGLAVTKAIVEAHQGMISADAAQPTGTTFRVWLPSTA